MKPLEKSIENKACRKIKKEFPGTQILKLNVRGRRGWPDRLILLPYGIPVLIEFKRPGEELRKLQKVIKRKIEELGHDVWVCETWEEAIEICKEKVSHARRK